MNHKQGKNKKILAKLIQFMNTSYISFEIALRCSPIGQGSGLPSTYLGSSLTLLTFFELWSLVPLPTKKKRFMKSIMLCLLKIGVHHVMLQDEFSRCGQVDSKLSNRVPCLHLRAIPIQKWTGNLPLKKQVSFW